MIKYSKEFIEECKRVYPNWKELHKALEEGKVIVGRMLDDSRYDKITNDEILTASSLKELQDKANKIKDKNNLYSWWFSIYDSVRDKIK